jgi:hypothetical protein
MGLRFRERIDVLALIGGEPGSLALKRKETGRAPRSAAMAFDFNRLLANRMQFLMGIGLLAIGAWFLFDLVRGSVGSLDRVSHFLAG